MKNLLILLTVIISMNVHAQTYIGVHSSNYDPLKSILFNPATPATSLTKWSVNVMGFDMHATQDYLKLVGSPGDWGDFDKDVNVEEILNGKDKNGNVALDAQFPSFMVNTKKQGAFSFYLRAISIVDADDISENFLHSLYNDVNNIYEWANNIDDDYLALNVQGYGEMALGYSRTAYTNGKHALSVGGTVKMLVPFAAANGSGNLDITIDEDAETANFGTTSFSAISSEIVNLADDEDFNFKFKVAGFGLDLGAVYELKTGYGQTKVVGKNKNKVKIQPDYFLKAGIGFINIGTIKHQHSVYSRNFVADGSTVPLSAITQGDSSFIDFDEVLDALGTWTPYTGSFKSKLPTSMTLFADIKLTRGIYINVSGLINLGTFSADKPKAREQNIVSITPRFELPAIGIQMPMAYNPIDGFEMGASIRAGQFVIGSSNIFSYLWSKEATSVDFQFAVAFGVVDKTQKKAAKDGMDEEHRWMETGENAPKKRDKKDKKSKDGDGEELKD